LETPNLAKVGIMPAPKKYPDELRERAVRMVFAVREESGQQQGAIARVADRLGINRETLRNWVKQAEIDTGQRPGTSTVDAQRIAELERENRELRRANEILKAASAFFARELDPRLPK
jgi:transposase